MLLGTLLTLTSYFYNYRNMELINCSGNVVIPPCYGDTLPSGADPQDSFVDSVLNDAVFNELKKQSANGCLLCSFDAWDGEEWD